MDKEYIIAVDKFDFEIGKIEKLEAHKLGILHRAFSIFVFNSKNELLLQQRADSKYHSGGLWTNTCCSHPNYGETTEQSIKNRLQFEMGMECKTKKVFDFIYRVEFENGLIEHEFDHVYFGYSDDKPKLNKDEAKDARYISLFDLKNELTKHPEQFTEWFKISFNQVEEEWKKQLQ